MTKVRWGILSTANIGMAKVLPAMQRGQYCEIAAIGSRDEAKAQEIVASRLRDAARDTQDVLSAAIAKIPGCPLRVVVDDNGDARLVLKTDRSETERFDELSDGERWPIIIGLAAGADRIIVLPQAAYGELSDATRTLLDGLARQHGCYIHSAQVDDGPLRCEAWSNSSVSPNSSNSLDISPAGGLF